MPDRLDTILNAAYQPKGDLEESLCDNTSDSCDAVQVHYQVVGKDGTTEIRVIQTLYIIVVIVHPERAEGVGCQGSFSSGRNGCSDCQK